MPKNELKVLIETLVSKYEISNHAQLLLLLKKSNYVISQSTLSRYLKKIGVQKFRQPDGSFIYFLPEKKPAMTSIVDFEKRFLISVNKVKRSNFIVLVITNPGEASFIATVLDETPIVGLLGTVAGDDTVLCVFDNNRNAIINEGKFKNFIS